MPLPHPPDDTNFPALANAAGVDFSSPLQVQALGPASLECYNLSIFQSMKIALVIFATLLVLAVVCYLAFFPSNTFITFSRPGGRSVTLSRTSVSVRPAPDRYPTNGFAYVPSYMSRLQSSRSPRASVI